MPLPKSQSDFSKLIDGSGIGMPPLNHNMIIRQLLHLRLRMPEAIEALASFEAFPL